MPVARVTSKNVISDFWTPLNKMYGSTDSFVVTKVFQQKPFQKTPRGRSVSFPTRGTMVTYIT